MKNNYYSTQCPTRAHDKGILEGGPLRFVSLNTYMYMYMLKLSLRLVEFKLYSTRKTWVQINSTKGRGWPGATLCVYYYV